MSVKSYLIQVRSHIITLLAFTVATVLIFTLEAYEPAPPQVETVEVVKYTDFQLEETFDLTLPALSPLSHQEREWAQIAWKYFENNYIPETGLVNSVDNYQASTMWDTASYLMALIAAERLELVERTVFDERLTRCLETLAQLPLFEDALPNKSYNTVSLAMVNYNNEPTEQGIGWSAIDIGRLLVPFNIIVWNYPQYTKNIQAILTRWNFDKIVKDGVLYGAAVNQEGQTEYLQEGRIGYEEYASKSLSLMGLDLFEALKYHDFLQYVNIYDIAIPTDERAPEEYEAHNYVVSEPYILDGLEFGWDEISQEFAYRIYKAQERRFAETGILTAVSEDNIDQSPYFVYNTVFTSGKAWNCITEDGQDATQFKTISTKAVFGWHVLYRTPYTQQLLEKAQDLYDAERGWYSGYYEALDRPNKAMTCNTNAIILESLHYKQTGRLMRVASNRD